MGGDGPRPFGHVVGMACARCDVFIQHQFVKPINEIRHIIHDGEFATLEDFEIELFCPSCGDKTITTARGLVIDIERKIILSCEIDPIPGDHTPPDYVPDDL